VVIYRGHVWHIQVPDYCMLKGIGKLIIYRKIDGQPNKQKTERMATTTTTRGLLEGEGQGGC